MKNGLIPENGELIYYKNGHPEHAGAIEIDGDIYYISSKGRAVKGEYIVHSEMSNGILKRGTYTFGDDCKLVKGSYIAPKKRRKKKSRSSSKKKNLMPILAIIPVCLILGCIALWLFMGGNSPAASGSAGSTEPSQSEQTIFLPTFNDEILLCSESAKKLYDNQISAATAVQTGEPYRTMAFEYNIGSRSGLLQVSEDPELTNAREFIMAPSSRSLTIDNLKTGTTYYYKVTVEGKEYPGSFRTAASTRFISIPGISNLRDIGGYQTLDGKTVRQGVLIRGVEIDGLVAPTYYIPNDALEEVRRTFGFVYDFDLREPTVFNGTYQSRLGTDVGHRFYSAPMYGQIFNPEHIPTLKSVFSDLAKPENYPMYLHCTWGADRTGTVVFLLQGILNMSQEDMEREFCMTGFNNRNWNASNGLQAMVNGLEAYEGETIQEKIITYLTTVVGVTEAEIDTIRSIFLSE